jgi:transcriptional regulator with XRE-family HTH domain
MTARPLDWAACPRCGGTGRLVRYGRELRAARQRSGLSLREVASRLDFTAAYLCDLELDRRNCSTALRDRYLKALR